MKTKGFVSTLLTLFVCITASAETWTDANGTEWYFTTEGSNATITCRYGDGNIPSISGTIPEELIIPSMVYIGETPYTVNVIGERAFYNCSNLTSVIIPDGVTIIGNDAFWECSSLTSVTIPNSVTSIGNYVFVRCTNLATINMGNGIRDIGVGAFNETAWYNNQVDGIVYIGNIAYTYKGAMPENASIEIKDGTQSIGVSAFSSCENLHFITLPNSLKTIESSAFQNCSSLTSVTIPEGVTSIGWGAFYNCSCLKSVTIPDELTSISGCAFYGCSSLTSITIPDGVTTIESSAFQNCSSLTSVTIPEGVTSIGWGAFSNCGSLTSIVVNEGNTVFDSRDGCNAVIKTTSNVLIIGCQNTIIPENVTAIGSGAFQYCSSLTSITIPEGVTSIGGCAFESCYNLTSITIPEGVTCIEDETFSNCGSLTSIIIPNGVTSLGEFAFQSCSRLTSITLPETLTSIGGYTFDGCYSLKSITIPENVTSIGPAFESCNSLKSIIVSMKNPFIQIYERAFSEHYETATLYVPAGSKAAYQSAYIWKDFKEIKEYNYVDGSQNPPVEHPENIWTDVNGTEWYFTTNESNATISNRGWDNVNNDYIPSISGIVPIELVIPSIVYIGETPYSVTSIGYDAFTGCSYLTSISIPESVTTIGTDAFYGCSHLTSINIPKGVTSIEWGAFYDCSCLASITIPEGVARIEDNAFNGCIGLTSVIACMQAPVNLSMNSSTFGNCDAAILYVPIGSKAAYQAAAGWKDFKEIVEMGTDISQLNNAIYIEPFAAKVGANTQMEICLKNAETATAYVFDLVLPEGITVATNDKGKYIDELSDRHDDHTRTINYKGENTYSLSTLSGNSEELTGNDGAIRLVTIAVSDNVAEGHYAIDIKNASYSKPDGTLVSLPDVRAVVTVEDYVLGDVNGNGGVDIGDAVSIVNYLVGKESSNFVEKAADTNKNGQIDIGDAVTIVNLLVGKITNFTREFNIIWDEKEPE